MESFISEVVSKFEIDDLNKSHFVLPSRRAAQAFAKELFKKHKENFLVPPIQSIEEFIESVSGVDLIGNLDTLFYFYEVYKENTNPNKQEPLEQVYNWGQLIIQDFNEIDRYQIDSKQFFGNLKAIKDIEHWSKSEVKTDLVKNYIEFWETLPKYHTELKLKLKSENKAYQGMAYSEAVSDLEDYLNESDNQFYFIGFNALNSCEESMFQYIIAQKRGNIFWDIDQHLLKENSAGMFMRNYAKNWPSFSSSILKSSTESFSNTKHINLYGVPKKIGQAKLIGDILSDLSESELNKTALILGDETLLQPILNSLPKNISDVNITMGLPLESTSFASFFETLFKIRTSNQMELYYKKVFELIEHSSLKKEYHQDVQKLKKKLIENNVVFLTKEELIKDYEILDENFLKILEYSISNKDISVDEFLSNCLEIIELLKINFQDEKLTLEYLFGFKKLFNALRNLLSKSDLIKDFKVFHQIYVDALNSETLDFEGSPYQGLQIMGMLETRVLDFKNIIITSVNEGILPSGKSQNSFIPFDLKKAYKLPTFKEKDAIYAYHFFRLIQRAEHCHFTYNNSTSGIEKAEKSRFLTQLETFKLPKHIITDYRLTSTTDIGEPEEDIIKKTPEMMSQLQSLLESGISPSALTTYIRNPIDFYKRYILGLNDIDEIEEDISYKTLGTVIHDCLDLLYRNFKDKILEESDIDTMLNIYSNTLTILFQKKFQKEALEKGKNLIDFEIAKQQVKRFLLQEKSFLKKNNKIKIVSLEEVGEKYIQIKGLDFKIKLKGTIDRVDSLNDETRIIDYKTGKVETSQLKIPSEWKDFTEDYKYSKAFQVLFYALLKEESLGKNAKAGIISFKNLKSGFMACSAKDSNLDLKEILDDYKTELERLILEIINPEIPFREKN